jgi:long-chain acyl-CoA synthetase
MASQTCVARLTLASSNGIKDGSGRKDAREDMMADERGRERRPWIAHYPEGIAWEIDVDLTPVHERVLARTKAIPDAPALDFLGAKTKYGELGRQIEAMAGALQHRYGVKRGTRVALLLPNTPFYVVAYYAVLRAGGTVVNCNPLYSLPELQHILANSGADVMVTLDIRTVFEKAETLARTGQIKQLIVGHFPRVLPAVKGLLFRLAKHKDLADIRHSPVATKITDFHKLVSLGLSAEAVAVNPESDVAVQQYTGGTTGIPKGAMLSHANVSANIGQLSAWAGHLFEAPSKVAAVLPFFHIFSMTACMNLPLAGGAEVVMLPRFELKAFLALMSRTKANVLIAVPTLVLALAKAGEHAKVALGAVEIVISGGAPLVAELRDRWAKVSSARIAEGYGLTEASPVVCVAALTRESKPGSVGYPIPATDLRFIDVDTGEEVPLGERGEIQVKGPQVMLGYYSDPEATRASFTDGWLRTGDVGYVDEEGYVFIVDRIKDLIISSGFNVYPRVIEEALMSHPAVDEVSVIGVPDEYRGEAPVAFIKLRDSETVSELELRKFLSTQLNRMEMPKEIIFKDSLPKTMIGKLSKKELRVEYQDRVNSDEPA